MASESSARKRTLEILVKACRFFQFQAENDPQAQDYLRDRGVDLTMRQAWRIGFASRRVSLISHLARLGYAQAEIIDAGLAISDGDVIRDRFSDRIIFPILDEAGFCRGFSGRIFRKDDRRPKYINSPASPHFKKGEILYGLHAAAPSIQARGRALILEGQLDVIHAHSHGCSHAVAPLGTSLTCDHVFALARHARGLDILLDRDEAGRRATWVALATISRAGADLFDEVDVALVSMAKDVAEWSRTIRIAHVEEEGLLDRMILRDRMDAISWMFEFASAQKEISMLSFEKAALDLAAALSPIGRKQALARLRYLGFNPDPREEFAERMCKDSGPMHQ